MERMTSSLELEPVVGESPRATPRDHQGVVPPRAGALVPGPRLRSGEAWTSPTPASPDGVRSALFVNLLTEDNLPYYFRDIERLFGRDDAGASGPGGGRPRRVATRSSSATT